MKRPDAFTAIRRADTPGLSHGDYLLLFVLRRIAHGCELPALAARQLGERHEAAGRAEALATLRGFLVIMACAARRRICVAPPGWREPTADERRILSLVGSAQRGDEPALETLATWFARPDLRTTLTGAARGVAAALDGCGMAVSTACGWRSTGVLSGRPKSSSC